MFATETPTERRYQLAVTVIGTAAGVALLYYGRVLIVTMMIAAIIAFLLEPAVQVFMRFRMPRGLASFVACSVTLVVLYLAGVGVYTETVLMTDDLPAYEARISELLNSATGRVERFQNGLNRLIMPRRAQEVPPPQPDKGKRGKTVEPATPPVMEVRLQTEPHSVLADLYQYSRGFYDVLLMASFVPFLVYFWLAWGGPLRERLLSSLEGERRITMQNVLDGVGRMVRAYVIGNFLLGVLLSIASGILFASVELPYWLVVAPMSGFLSLVPYIGMPLAMVPPLIAALPVTGDPKTYLFLMVSVALLHLLALNLLYPKFVGSRVHLNPLVATIALMFWGMVWGAIGLVLAIPITAAIRAVCENVDEWRAYSDMLGD